MSHLAIEPNLQEPQHVSRSTYTDSTFTKKDSLEIVQREIQFAQTLITSRMNWYVTSQAFLMSAFAISGGHEHNFPWLAKGIIPPLGIIISIMMWFALGAALETMKQLRASASELMDGHVLKNLPFVGVELNSAHMRRSRLMTPQVMPIVFGSAWVSALFLVWTSTPDF